MATASRIYLDNAATSWPKPTAVYDAVDHYQREQGAAAGRGTYSEASEVERQVLAARRAVAKLLNIAAPERIVFTFNGTDALNLAIHGLLRSGDHVITSVAEHNSVLRPLSMLEQQGVAITRIGCNRRGLIDPSDFAAALRRKTRLVVMTHASNVTGAIQPVAEIASMTRAHGAVTLVDAAQSLGHLGVSVEDLGCDLLAAPGHKGLLGPLGTGVLYVGPGVEEQLASLRQGGTGSRSHEDRQPEVLPDKYEAGNLNVGGIIGLKAGVEYLLERTMSAIRAHEMQLTQRLIEGLRAVPNLRVFGPAEAADRVGVVSVALEGYDPQEVAAALDAIHRVQVRAGLHCAPLMHRALGTLERGGTVRFSVGPFNTELEIDTSLDAIRTITVDKVSP